MARHHKREKAIRLDLPERREVKRKAKWEWKNLLPQGLVETLTMITAIVLAVLGAFKIAVAVAIVMVGWMGIVGRLRGKK